MDFAQALAAFPQLVEQHQAATARLAQVEAELAALKDDHYVTWEWICKYFGITLNTAKLMLADEYVFVHGHRVKRIKKSTVLKYAKQHSIKAKDIHL